jgi:hypothetical protein
LFEMGQSNLFRSLALSCVESFIRISFPVSFGLPMAALHFAAQKLDPVLRVYLLAAPEGAFLLAFVARLKACPDTKPSGSVCLEAIA